MIHGFLKIFSLLVLREINFARPPATAQTKFRIEAPDLHSEVCEHCCRFSFFIRAFRAFRALRELFKRNTCIRNHATLCADRVQEGELQIGGAPIFHCRIPNCNERSSRELQANSQRTLGANPKFIRLKLILELCFRN